MEITTVNDCKVVSDEIVYQISSIDNIVSEDEIIKVYPNPVQDILYIQKTVGEMAYFRIMDLCGLELYQGSIPENTHLFSLTMEQFSAGMYYIKIQLQNKEIIIPFILTK
ncbi:MAG: T9SS type A sorting domain-containing protein [Ignavibacteria bacterium]|nr:T9SS type A sorting domain-containing protein [Ignavibacteria bacterium]